MVRCGKRTVEKRREAKMRTSILIFSEGEISAMNAEARPDGLEVMDLCFEMVNAAGTAPEWVELIPAGTTVIGRDGRRWINDDPAAVVASLNARGTALPFDFEHSTELKAPKGEEAPAAGWGTEFQAREGGSIWGRISWTPRGQAAVANREYRYLSPVLLFEKATGRIRSLSSVGLVNKPNLLLPALNRQQSHTEEDPMDLKKLLAKLGMPETATLEEALNAVGKIQGDLATATNRAETPSLEKFVPRSDFDQALARAANAEQKLQEKEAAEREAAINSEIDAALKASKITPGSKDQYLAICRQSGVEEFKKLVAVLPVIAGASGLDGKTPPAAETALNAQEKEVLEKMAIAEEDYKKYNPAK